MKNANPIDSYSALFCRSTLGTGKSVIFANIMRAYQVKRHYDIMRESRQKADNSSKHMKDEHYRHAILNEAGASTQSALIIVSSGSDHRARAYPLSRQQWQCAGTRR